MIHPISNLPLSSKHRVSQIKFHPTQPYLAVQSHDRSVEIFRVRSEEEVRKKQARRKKRAKEKSQQEDINEKEGNPVAEPDTQVEEIGLNFVDYFTPYLVVRASGKIRSFDFGPNETSSKGITQVFSFFSGIRTANLIYYSNLFSKLFAALSSNAIEVYNVPQPTKSKDQSPEATRSYSVELPGHRADVRTLCISSDDQILASASNGIPKSNILLVTSNPSIRFLENMELKNSCMYSHHGMWIRNLQHILAW